MTRIARLILVASTAWLLFSITAQAADQGIAKNGSASSQPVAAAAPINATTDIGQENSGKDHGNAKSDSTAAAALTQLSNVVVTASPISFTNSRLPKRLVETQTPSVTSVVDKANLLPGVNINGGGIFDSDVWSTRITMRGFSTDDFGFTVDGLPNGATAYGGGQLPNRYLDPENTCGVSVSQGTADISSPSLQALGGTFNYESCDPTAKRHATVAYSVGSYDTTREFGRYNTGAIFGGNTYAYASLSHTYNERWIGSGSNGHTDRWHVDSKILSYLTPTLTVTGRASYDDAYENNYNSVSLAQFHEDPTNDGLTWNWTGDPILDQNFAEGWSTKRKNVLAGVKFDWQPTKRQQYTFYPYYHWQKGYGGWLPPYQLFAVNNNGQPIDRHPADGDPNFYDVYYENSNGQPLPVPADCKETPDDASCYPPGSNPVSTFRQSLYNMNRYGTILNGQWNIDVKKVKNQILAGTWLQDRERINGRVWNAVLNPKEWWSYDHQYYYKQFNQLLSTLSAKLYAQDKISFGPVDLSVGLTKWLVSLKGKDRFTNKQFASVNSNSKVLPSIGAVYHLNGHQQLYASYTDNFAALSDSIIQDAADGTSVNNVSPETSKNYDFGYRYDRSRLSASIAGYFVRFSNYIDYLSPTSSTVNQIDYDVGTNGTYINSGGVKSRGAEAMANFRLTHAVSLYASATYDHSVYLGDLGGDFVPGNRVAGQPSEMLVLAATYAKNGIRFGINGKYVGGRYADKQNRQHMPNYTIFNGNAGYRWKFENKHYLDLALNVQNIFNKSYVGGLDGDDYPASVFIGEPRTIVLTMSARY